MPADNVLKLKDNCQVFIIKVVIHNSDNVKTLKYFTDNAHIEQDRIQIFNTFNMLLKIFSGFYIVIFFYVNIYICEIHTIWIILY